MKIKLTYYLFFFLDLTLQLYSQTNPSVVITDHNNNTGTIPIDCDYQFKPIKKIELTASFPDLKTTTDYSVAQVAYHQNGNYSDGTPIVFTGDDTWSTAIPIGFSFCFYNNNYNTVNVGDNGIVRFGYNSSLPEGSFSSITNTTPSPSLVKNAIFGGFQDMLNIPAGFGCAPGENCGTVTYVTTGTAPFRIFTVNYNEVNHFNCTGFNGRKSTFQIVLYETTNVIEINVKSKPITCNGNISANGNANSLLGLNNSDGTIGISPPNRNTGVWSAMDESYTFTPNGASATTVQWFNAGGTLLGTSNPIEVIPTGNTLYTVKVNYATCVPQQLQSSIDVVYDLDYPVAPNVVGNFCDTTAPFPSEIIDVESLLIPEPSIIKTIYNTQAEADADSNALTGVNAYLMTASTKTFIYRETIGDCYATGTITLNLFQTPEIGNQILYVCDANNDGSETVTLSSLTSQIIGYQNWMGISYYQNQANAIAGTNPFNTVTVLSTPGFYDIYVRAFNPGNPNCWSVALITIRISPKLELAPVASFCINDPDFNLSEIHDLTTIPLSIITGPATVGDLTLGYYISLANAQNSTNPIGNPGNHVVSIPSPSVDTTIYITANYNGYCQTVVPVTISFCEAEGNDGGGGGGGGGNGGFGACLEAGDPIPSYDLNLVYTAAMSPITPVPAPLGFYTTLVGAQTQDSAVQLTAAAIANFVPVSPLSEVWVRFNDANGIPGIKRIFVPVKFVKHENKDIEICDIYNNGSETVALAPYIAEIQLENPGETVTCFATQADYTAGTNPITSINVIAPNTIVYVKVSSYGCDSNYDLNFILTPFDVRVPILEKICDINSDNSEPYNLAALIPSLITGFTNPTLSYHSTLNGAYNETNIIPNNTTNYPVNTTTTVWARIEEDPAILPKTCPTIQEINFDFYNSVSVNTIGTIEVCDTDNDAHVVLSNLNAIVASIVNEIPAEPITKKLYYNLAAAQTNDPVYEILPDWDTFVYDSNVLGVNGIIYLYLKNDVTGCERIVAINLQMRSFPLSTNSTVSLCDFENDNSETVANMSFFNPQITANYLLYTYAYFLNSADANAGTPVLPSNYTLHDGNIVYVRITSGNQADCVKVIPIEIDFKRAPIVTNITPVICDNLGNGTETVNLNFYQNQIVAVPSDYTFKYYDIQNNALQDLNAFSNFNVLNYTIASFDATNLSAPIYVRVISNTTGCVSIATITFKRYDVIEAYDAISFSCDISLTNELQGVFNLTTLIPRVGTNGMIANPSNYTISYHTTPADANAGSNPINTPGNYTVYANQTSYVYVRFVDTTTGCYTVKRIELQIYNLPKFVNSTYDVCDDNLDGVYTLNLASLNGTVVEDPTPYTFQYFLSETDAYANNNPIANFTNFIINLNEFPKTVYVKGTNSNNCSKVKSVVLEHKPEVPLLSNSVTLLECDPNNDGVATFNLTEAQALVTNQAGIAFTYFTSIPNLQANSNSISNPTVYQNLTPNPSVVYVRLSSPASNCDAWATITLHPFYQEYALPAQITLCDNNADGTEEADLDQIVLDVLLAITPSDITLEFYNSAANAASGVNIISNSHTYTFTNFSTPLFVKITNIATGCPIIKELHFITPQPIVLTPANVSLCDFDRNGSEAIHLIDYFNLMSSVSNTYTVTSYHSELGANNATATDQVSNSNYFLNQPQKTFWIRFQDANGCYSVTSLEIDIIPFPNSNLHPNPIELCDTTNPGDVTETFDLTLNQNYIVNGSTDLVTYHTSLLNAQNGNNPIANPAAYPSPTASIWIRITTNPVSSITNCAVIVEQKIKVIPLPTPNMNPVLLQKCDINNTGDMMEYFDLSQNTAAISNGNPTYLLSYHTTQASAQTGTNPIVNPTHYLSGTNSIWVRVTTNTPTALTSCVITVEQKLEVVALPTPKLNPLPIVICDDVNSGDLKEFFNLTANENYIRNGNSTYIITYHLSLSDAQNALSPIAVPTNYESQTRSIWIRIVTSPVSNLTSCAIVIEQKLIVNPLPVAGVISDYYSCSNSNTTSATFYLNTKNNEALSNQNSAQFSVSYHETEQQAKNSTNPLPLTYISVTKTIWAGIKNNTTGCIAVSSLKLIAETTTTATQPDVLLTTLCDTDEENNGLTEFNLSDLNSVIFGPNQTDPNYEVHYYASESNLTNHFPITDPAHFINTHNPQTVYAFVVNNGTVNKCSAVVSFDLKVNLLPEPTPNGGTVCYDQITGNLVSSHIIDSHLSANTHTFEWFQETNPIANQTGATLEVTVAGDYFVIATEIQTDCESEPAMATVIKSESAVASARVEYSFNDVVNIIVTATGIGNYNYQLDNNPIQQSPLFEDVSPGTHTISVLDLNGCNNTVLEVIVLNYDKFFTPNGDGYNDYWQIEGVYDQPEAKIHIFDRYGKLLKQLDPRGQGWDGTFNGSKMPADDYWFTVIYIENGEQKEFKSHFAMKR
ncbi:T9SS type B sorting domain-containing protein [Flavobacterium sp.]|uniref:T9SS type B sorting domain-containing protein n=1 Tax=Flavobacterium sp. TaxID=239 RepID=UPI003D6A48C2